jgi:hypothetical protein
VTAKRIGAATLLVVATLLWSAATLGIWAKRQALNTDNWVQTSSRLLQNDPIRNALAVALVDRLYNTAAVQKQIQDALPPRLDRLAAPAAAGLREVALRNAPRVLGSPAALKAWQAANRGAHTAFIAIVDGKVAKGGVVKLNVQDLVRRVAAGTGLPAGVADKIPPSVATIQVLKSDQVKTAQDAVRGFRDAVWVLLALAVISFAGAIALATERRRGFVNAGICIMISALLVIAVRRVAGTWVEGQLADAPNAQAVWPDIWSISTSMLVDAIEGSFLFGLIVASAAWIAGPGRVATGARRFSAPALRDHPGYCRGALAVVLLLLVAWGPVPWTNQIVPILIVTVAAFAWLEWLRHRTEEEFAGVESSAIWGPLRARLPGAPKPRPDDTAPAG